MIGISASTRVDAPPEAVFGLVNTPTESVRAGASQSFSNVRPLDNGGHEYEYVFRMVGVELSGTVRTTRHDAPRTLTLRYAGDIDGTVAFGFERLAGDATAFDAEARYEMPGRVVEAVAGPVVRRYNQRELEGFLANVRDRVEAAYDPSGTEYGAYGLGDARWEPEPLPTD